MAKQNKGRKFFAASATAALVASAIVPVASAAQLNDYNKISGYAKEAVQSLVDNGVIEGDANGNFNPLKTISRAEAATIFTKALELEADGSVDFKDVKTGAWYYDAIAAAVSNGIFEGVSATEFAPNKSLTRSEAAKILVDAFGLEGSESLSQFADASSVKPWAKSYLETAVANGIFTGSETNGKLNLNPNASITRQDFAVVFARTLDLAVETVDASIKAINNTTVEVTFDEEVNVDDVKASNFKIDGLEVKNASVKQTNKKVVVLTTEAQTADKEYVLSYKEEEIGKFKGIAAVIPTKIDVTTTSVQGVIGKEVTLKAQVTVAEGQSKAGIPVTFNIVSDNANVNAKIEVEALTDENGVASYSYTRYYEHNDNVAAYATSKSSVSSTGKVYWANKIQLAVSEITTGNELANNTKKSYKVVGAKNTTYYVAIKENLEVNPDKIVDVKVQDHNNSNFVTPYELTTGKDEYAKVQTNANGEATFTLWGSNLSATPIVYLPSSVNKTVTDLSYSKLALQSEAPTVKFSKIDKLAITVAAEGTAESAEFLAEPKTYDQNSVGGRNYTVTVTDKDGKLAPEGTVAYVTFEDGNFKGDVYFSTAKENFVKVTADTPYKVTVGKEGKAQFHVAGKGATTFAKPTVFLNTSGDKLALDKNDVQAVAEVTYFKAPVVNNAKLKVTDEYGRTISSTTAGKDAFFTYQSVDQNGFDYRPTGYKITGDTTQLIWEKVVAPDGTIAYIPKYVTVTGETVYEYNLAFDVTSTFGNATVKDASGKVLAASQNLGNTKTYQVKSDAYGQAIVRVTTDTADTVSVNVTGASNILPTQTASVTFTNSSVVPSLYTGVVDSYDSIKRTLKFAGKDAVSYAGEKVYYRNLNNTPIATAEDFEKALANATGTVQVTYEVKDGVTTFYIYSVATTGNKPVDTAAAQPGAEALATAIKNAENANLKEADYTAESWKVYNDALVAAKAVAPTAADSVKAAAAKALNDARTALKSVVPVGVTAITSATAVADETFLGQLLGNFDYTVAGTVADVKATSIELELTLADDSVVARTVTITPDASGKFTVTFSDNDYDHKVKAIKAKGTEGAATNVEFK
ncbi:S-layer homology domain-containing protein [Lysinibacillus sp. A4]|uniref:S-layer homology domain-containing protein n=1 Tax=Lysinibacillus sp. A4 TaxID=2976269 RepID=UPI002176156C|nr:S-layer homology domain-containing protein [Lysinibacillus sp. A4]MCS5502052.1 S-layer homology domain-containing protein [Lysinibacillus sp. A4]